MRYENVLSVALSKLSSRQEYAKNVLLGRQLWSGADLRGRARHYGGSYSAQRRIAASAWKSAGGEIVAREHGRIIHVVKIGADDFGNALYIDGENRVYVASDKGRVKTVHHAK